MNMWRLGAKVKLCPQCSEKIMCRAFGFQVEVSNERWILKNRVKKKKKGYRGWEWWWEIEREGREEKIGQEEKEERLGMFLWLCLRITGIKGLDGFNKFPDSQQKQRENSGRIKGQRSLIICILAHQSDISNIPHPWGCSGTNCWAYIFNEKKKYLCMYVQWDRSNLLNQPLP